MPACAASRDSTSRAAPSSPSDCERHGATPRRARSRRGLEQLLDELPALRVHATASSRCSQARAMLPLALDGRGGDAQRLGGLFDGQPAEEAQLDHLALSGVESLEAGEGLVDLDEVGGAVLGDDQGLV